MNPVGYGELKTSGAFLPQDPGAGLLTVAGPDREKFFQAMLTQQIQGLATGQGREAAVLDREGRIIAAFAIFVQPESYILRVEEGRAATLKAFLDKFKIAAKVDIEAPTPVLQARSFGGILGPEAGLALTGSGEAGTLENLELRYLGSGASQILLRWDRFGFPLHEFWCAPGRAMALEKEPAAGQFPTASSEALTAHRIESRRPYFNAEERGLIPNDLPQLENMVSFSKGCFPGQEVVIRIKHRGQPGQRLVLLRAAEAGVPPKGTSLAHEGQEAGRVMASAYCPNLKSVGILALLRRVPAKVGNRIDVSGFGSAEVVG